MTDGEDNHKSGTSEPREGNNSNQAFIISANREKSNHRKQTGGKPSQPQQKTQDQSSNRNSSVDVDSD